MQARRRWNCQPRCTAPSSQRTSVPSCTMQPSNCARSWSTSNRARIWRKPCLFTLPFCDGNQSLPSLRTRLSQMPGKQSCCRIYVLGPLYWPKNICLGMIMSTLQTRGSVFTSSHTLISHGMFWCVLASSPSALPFLACPSGIHLLLARSTMATCTYTLDARALRALRPLNARCLWREATRLQPTAAGSLCTCFWTNYAFLPKSRLV